MSEISEQTHTIMFCCGGNAAGVIVRDIALQERAWAQTREYNLRIERERFAATGKSCQFPTLDEQAEFYDQAYRAEERRVTMSESLAIDAAIELLERHKFSVSRPIPEEADV